MKVIDLLNKIANGEEVPEKIHIKEFQSDFIFNGYTYLSDEKEQQNIYWLLHSSALNYKVEVLEEEKKIPEKLLIGLKATKENEVYNTLIIGDRQYELNEKEEMICKKIHEIIDYLQSKGEK